MARRFISLLLVVVAFVSCSLFGASDLPPPPPPLPIVPPFVVVHADVDFTPTERAEIAESIARLQRAPVDIDVTYDLDFGSNWSVATHIDHNMLVRVTSDDPLVMEQDDGQTELLGLVVGIDLSAPDFSKPRITYLVADRLEKPVWFEHVFEHEMLHVFGLRHVSDPRAVMFEQVTADAGVELTAADQKELCRLWCP